MSALIVLLVFVMVFSLANIWASKPKSKLTPESLERAVRAELTDVEEPEKSRIVHAVLDITFNGKQEIR